QRAAIQGAKLGKRVALAEKREVIGGACINTGTIPSKSMREAVMHLSGYQYHDIYGINYRVKENITIADLSFRVQHVVKTEIDVTQAQLSRNGVDVVFGAAGFLDPHRVQVNSARGQSDEYQAENIVVATGTRPAESPNVPINNRTIINSDQIFSLAQLPRTLIVVGGGVIGVEYASMFAALGIRVVLIEKMPKLLGFASLASVSMEQGRIAAGLAFGSKLHSDPANYPYGIYTIPEISFVGKTEEQLTDEDVPYEVGVAYYREIARGQIRGDTTGRL